MKPSELASLALALAGNATSEEPANFNLRLRLRDRAERAMIQSFDFAAKAANSESHKARGFLSRQDAAEDDCLVALLGLEFACRPLISSTLALELATDLLARREDYSLEELFYEITEATI